MSEVSEAIVRWLEQKRRTDRASAAVISVLALGSGAAVFLLVTFLIYTVLSVAGGAFGNSTVLPGFVAFGLTAGFFVISIKAWAKQRELELDPMGIWILKDIFSIGPRFILEGLRQVRCCGQLGELDVAALALALAYLAAQNRAVNWHDLVQHCPQLPGPQLREQLSLLDGVLFLGNDAGRVTLMEPFRLRLRWMLRADQDSAKRQQPIGPDPEVMPVNDPENLSAYEILGVSPSASMAQIKAAYRKRIKECHPDLFAAMDKPSRALAERWTRALNAAYATLNPRRTDFTSRSTQPR